MGIVGSSEGGLPEVRRPSTLPVRVARILKRYILLEELQPEDRLPSERSLAESLNISRTVLREALARLIDEGVVYRRSPRVLCVADFDRAEVATEMAPVDDDDLELLDLIELRVMIEIGSIELIIERASESDLRDIEVWVKDGERRADGGESIHIADARFHAALLRTLGNQSVTSLLPIIDDTLRRNLLVNPQPLAAGGSPDNIRAVREHRQIFEAIRRGDASQARHVMMEHLQFYLHRTKAPTERS